MNYYGVKNNVTFMLGSVFDMDTSESKYDIDHAGSRLAKTSSAARPGPG